jgi:hypothetical protein
MEINRFWKFWISLYQRNKRLEDNKQHLRQKSNKLKSAKTIKNKQKRIHIRYFQPNNRKRILEPLASLSPTYLWELPLPVVFLARGICLNPDWRFHILAGTPQLGRIQVLGPLFSHPGRHRQPGLEHWDQFCRPPYCPYSHGRN